MSLNTTLADLAIALPTLATPDTNDELVYKMHLATIYNVFEQMQQCWPIYSMWPTPSTHDATTVSLPLDSTMNRASLNTPDCIPSLPCTSAPQTCLIILLHSLMNLKEYSHCMSRCHGLCYLSLSPLPQNHCPLNALNNCHQCTCHHLQHHAALNNTQTQLLPAGGMEATDYHPNFNHTLPLMMTTNSICALYHYNPPQQRQHLHGSCSSVPCNTQEQPMLIALPCNRLDLGNCFLAVQPGMQPQINSPSFPLLSPTCSTLLPQLHLLPPSPTNQQCYDQGDAHLLLGCNH